VEFSTEIITIACAERGRQLSFQLPICNQRWCSLSLGQVRALIWDFATIHGDAGRS
jgi:hypothetical protein